MQSKEQKNIGRAGKTKRRPKTAGTISDLIREDLKDPVLRQYFIEHCRKGPLWHQRSVEKKYGIKVVIEDDEKTEKE